MKVIQHDSNIMSYTRQIILAEYVIHLKIKPREKTQTLFRKSKKGTLLEVPLALASGSSE